MKKRLLALVLTLCIVSTNTIGVLATSAEETSSQETVEMGMAEESGKEDESDEKDDFQETEEQRGAVFEKNQEDTETENTDIQDKTKIEQEEKQLEVSGEESTLMTTEQSEEVNGDKLEDDEVNIDENTENGNAATSEKLSESEIDGLIENAELEGEDNSVYKKTMLSKAGASASVEENIIALIEKIKRNGVKIDTGWKISLTNTSTATTYTASIIFDQKNNLVRFQLDGVNKNAGLDTVVMTIEYDLEKKAYGTIAGFAGFSNGAYFISFALIDPHTYCFRQELDFEKSSGNGVTDENIDRLSNTFKDAGFALWANLLIEKASMCFPWIGFTNLCNHKWNSDYVVDQEATCTEEGSKSIHCNICGTIDESSVQVIPKKEHSYGEWTVTNEATCTEAGSREKSCTVCGDKVNETIPPKGHQWETEYRIDQVPTRTEEGSKSIHCAVCDEINESTVQVIPVINGTWKKNSNGWWYSWNDGTYPKDQFVTIGSADYYFNTSGYMVTGWQKIDGKWYYFGGSGAMVTGWQSIGGKWYFFDENGEMAVNEWIGNYYLGAGGAMVTGWQKIDGSWYYFNSSGAKQTDWQKIGSTWYFLDENGVMQTGLTDVRGRVFYFSAGGAMQTGWQKIDGVWYYFEGNGVMAVNKWVGNYYLTESGEMAVNQWIGKYYVGADGKWIPGYAAN